MSNNQNILVDHGGFEAAKSSQSSIIDAYQSLYEAQQAVIDSMSAAWKGSSGDAFRSGGQELQSELLVAMAKLQQLHGFTADAQVSFSREDDKLAHTFTERDVIAEQNLGMMEKRD